MAKTPAYLRAPLSSESGGGYGFAYALMLLNRVRAGESVTQVCRDPLMPSTQTIWMWMQHMPGFAAMVREAREKVLRARRSKRRAARAAHKAAVLRRRMGKPPNPGRPSGYDDQIAELICDRIEAGVSLQALCRSPTMPCVATVYNWLRDHPDFAARYAWARRMVVEQMLDVATEVALNSTDATLAPDLQEVCALRRYAMKRAGSGGWGG